MEGYPFGKNIDLFRSTQQLPFLGLRPLKGFFSLHGALQGPSLHAMSLMDFDRNKQDTI